MSTLSLGSNNNNHNNGDGGGDEVFEDNSVHKQNIENLARGKPLIITNCFAVMTNLLRVFSFCFVHNRQQWVVSTT